MVFSNIILDSYVLLQISFKFEPQRSSCIGVQNQGRRQHKARKSRRYDFSLENIDVVQEEPINTTMKYNTNVAEPEEAVMVAFDRSGEDGELRIVTDPEEIRNIEIEEQERKRNVSINIHYISWKNVIMLDLSNFYTVALNNSIFIRRRVFKCYSSRSLGSR